MQSQDSVSSTGHQQGKILFLVLVIPCQLQAVSGLGAVNQHNQFSQSPGVSEIIEGFEPRITDCFNGPKTIFVQDECTPKQICPTLSWC